MAIKIRPIQPSDNVPLAHIIRSTLAEFNANHTGTAYFDPTTDTLFELFQHPRSSYFVAVDDDRLLGGGGLYPTEGLDEDTCELVKMYLLPEARGTGLGRKLIEMNLEQAKSLGYAKVYLETMPELKLALKVYEKFGFEYLKGPLGNSGHTGCSLWMSKAL